MENFKEKLKFNSETSELLDSVNQVYKKSGKELDFRDKVATAVYMAILDVDTKDEKEQSEKIEFMDSLNKIIYNYEYLRPIMFEYFKNKKSSITIEK